MHPIISGIQQIGIGVSDAKEAWRWYRKYFGMDVPIFEDADTAALMTKYTNQIAEDRYAVLAMNMNGGGGFEVWQYTSRVPQSPSFKAAIGDYGIFSVKIKSKNVLKSFAFFKSCGLEILNEPTKNPGGHLHFFLKDPYGNVFEMVQSDSWFNNNKNHTGGVGGCTIGVSDMAEALKFYVEILGYNKIIYDQSGEFLDVAGIEGGKNKFRRVLLGHMNPRVGAFSRLLCDTEIELIQVLDRKANKLFENRNWGDLGFIHVCFDINGMENLRKKCFNMGFPFTVDSSQSFDMGKAAGHFTYCEDPDGTLIEFVETHKIPIMEKWGWYLNLKKRKPEKSLPTWLLNMLALNRIKD